MAEQDYNAPIQLSERECSRMTSLLLQDVAASRAGLSIYHGNIDTYRNYMLDQHPDDVPMWDGASTLQVPSVKKSIQMLMADIIPSLCAVDPMLAISDAIPQYRPWADLWQDYYQDQLIRSNDSPFLQDFWWLVYRSLIDGTAVVDVMWDFLLLEQWAWETTSDDLTDPRTGMVLASNERTRRAVRVPQVAYEGPKLQGIDIKSFGTIPTANARLRNVPGIWRQREGVSLGELMDGARRGLFDADAVDALRTSEFPASDTVSAQDQQLGIEASRTTTDDNGERTGKAHVSAANQTLSLLEITYRFCPGVHGVMSDWQFILHEPTETLLTARPHPYWLRNGRRNTLVLTPYLNTGEIYGDSVASSGEAAVQDEQSALTQVMVNIAERTVNPRIAVPASMYAELNARLKKSAYNKPGVLVPMPDAMFEGGRTPYVVMDQGMNPAQVLPILQYLDIVSDRATSVSDVDRNVATPSETATASAFKAEARNRITGMLREHVAQVLQDIGEIIHDLTIQYMDRPVVQQRWQRICEAKGVQVPMEQAARRTLYISANGLTRSTSKQVQAQNAMLAFQTAMSLPWVQADYGRMQKNAEYLMQNTGGMPHPEDFIGTQEEAQQAQQQIINAQAEQLAQEQAEATAAGEAQMAQEAEQNASSAQREDAQRAEDRQLKVAQLAMKAGGGRNG